jgi:Spy/CpxP family protein refolding chaperone
MVALFSLALSLAAPLHPVPCSFDPEPGQKGGTRTSTQALQFAPPQGQRGPSDEEKERNRIRLGITQLQQQQIDALYQETRAKMDEVRKSMMEKQREIWETYADYDIDEAKAKSLRFQILRLHKKMGEIQADNEHKLRGILTREQFGRLRELMKEQFEKRRQEMERSRAGRTDSRP